MYNSLVANIKATLNNSVLDDYRFHLVMCEGWAILNQHLPTFKHVFSPRHYPESYPKELRRRELLESALPKLEMLSKI